jgi:hypothetical protein
MISAIKQRLEVEGKEVAENTMDLGEVGVGEALKRMNDLIGSMFELVSYFHNFNYAIAEAFYRN